MPTGGTDFIAAALVSAGIAADTAATIAPFAFGALTGAAFGAGSAAITGGNVGQGALFGGLSGGVLGGFLGPAADVAGGGSDAVAADPFIADAMATDPASFAGSDAFNLAGASSSLGLADPAAQSAYGNAGDLFSEGSISPASYVAPQSAGAAGVSTPFDAAAASSDGTFVDPALQAGTVSAAPTSANPWQSFTNNPISNAVQSITNPGQAAANAYDAAAPGQQVAADIAAEGTTANPYGTDSLNQLLTSGSSGSGSGININVAGAGASKSISPVALGLGALSAIGSALSKPKQTATPGPSSTAATQGPLFNTPLTSTGYLNRTPVAFPGATTNYWQTIAQQPSGIPQFFTGNQLNFAKGGALTAGREHEIVARPGPRGYPQPARMVKGGSHGQKDDVPARLSDDEYVIDATTLADAGNGNPDAGAKFFDHIREEIRKDKGRSKTPAPPIKSPLSYVRRAS